ncbi:MAG TPA: YceI family protein [Flavobacteriaceae bacterium]|nr:YceI family protein [Flavobacteriaceae bacterium]
MKNWILLLILGVAFNLHSQERFLTRTGEIRFEASVPSFEPVAAENNAVTAILNPQNGDIAALALVRGFRFENALMEEHFNENYAESVKYPKATLKGKIEGFSLEKLSETPTPFSLKAQLTFHGTTKTLTLPLQISKKGSTIQLRSNFVLYPKDFNIEIPGIVREKVAKEVSVEVFFELKKK